MSNDWHVQAWYSLASVTGLSLVSLGSPGLKSEMDEQIFTGGTTAVAQLLGEEVGGLSDAFMGGGATSRFGRFTLTMEDQQFYALFLLVSPKDPLPEALVEFSREFIIAFANAVMETQGSRLATGFEQIEHFEVQNEFEIALKIAKKKIRIPTDNSFLSGEVEHILEKALSDFSDYSSLQSLANDESLVREFLHNLRQKHSEHVKNLSQDIYLQTLKVNPLPIILCSNIGAAKAVIAEKTRTSLPKTVQTAVFHEQLDKAVEEVNNLDVPLILQSMDLISSPEAKEALHNKISTKLVERLREAHPLALLANTDLSFGKVSVEEKTTSLVDILIEKHDLGNTIQKLIVDLSSDPMCGLEIGKFARYFASRFPRGISPVGWSFLQYIFGSQIGSKKEISDLLKSKELPETHVEILKNEFKGRPKKSLEGIMIALEEGSGDEISTFFEAITASVAKGIAQFFDVFIGTYDKPGGLYRDYAYRLEDFCASADALYAAFRVIKTLATRKRDYPYLTDVIPAPEFLIKSGTGNKDTNEILNNPALLSQLWKSEENFSQAFQTGATTYFDSQVSQFQEHQNQTFNTIISLLHDAEKALEELERDKKPKVKDLVKKCEDLRVIPETPSDQPVLEKLLLELSYLKEAHLETRESLERIKNYLNERSRGKSVSKKAGKEKERVTKILKHLEKNRAISDNNLLKTREDFEKRVTKEANKNRKDIKKLRRDLRYKIIRPSDSKNGLPFASSRDYLQTVQNSMESLANEDHYLSELGSPAWLYAWSSILQKPPESALNKAFRDALTGSHKKVPMVKEIVKEISASGDYELAEILRDKLRIKTKHILNKMTSSFSDAKTWFLKQDPTVFRVTAEGKRDLYLVKIGELPENSFTPNVTEWFRRWEKATYLFQDGKAAVCLRLDVEGELGERGRLSVTLARAGMTTLKRRYKPYLDILETSCGILSSSRKEAFQSFLQDLEKQIDSAVE